MAPVVFPVDNFYMSATQHTGICGNSIIGTMPRTENLGLSQTIDNNARLQVYHPESSLLPLDMQEVDAANFYSVMNSKQFPSENRNRNRHLCEIRELTSQRLG